MNTLPNLNDNTNIANYVSKTAEQRIIEEINNVISGKTPKYYIARAGEEKCGFLHDLAIIYQGKSDLTMIYTDNLNRRYRRHSSYYECSLELWKKKD